MAAVSGNLNPYAQPGRAGVEPPSAADANQPPAPPIPEPDYSMSESEEEADNSVRLATSVPSNIGTVNTIKRNDQKAKEDTNVAETSGNSNTSGSSTGSSSMPHSFSVDEIQKIRTQLKSSKSFPNAFQNQDGSIAEGEGDNSSSGVSSDQEITMKTAAEPKPKPSQPIKVTVKAEEPKKVTIISTEDARSDEDSPSPPFMGFQRNNSLTRKQAAMIAANRARALAQAQGHAVSLTQLPPPIEADSDDEVDAGSMPSYIGKLKVRQRKLQKFIKFFFTVAPPPPEFSDIVSSTRSLHIPTQPSQMMRQHPPSHYMMQQQQMQYHQQMMHQQNQQRSVRIVGALPKQSGQQQQPPQQLNKMGHHHIHHYHSHSHHQHH